MGASSTLARKIPRLREPIVLVHGLMGFDEVRVAGYRVRSYFPGIEDALRAAGNRVVTARLSFTAGVAHRAAELRDFLHRELPGEPVHIFAHSMGGLDARYMISRLGAADRIRTLTTIGTPHRGTPFADWGVRHLRRFVQPVLDICGLPHQAFLDLTTEGCRAFNAEVPDVLAVRYFSIVGRCPLPWVNAYWLVPHEIVRRAEGANDGLVSVTSATWGEHTEVWECDHMSLVNWPNPQACALGLWRSRIRNYADHVRRLAALGY